MSEFTPGQIQEILNIFFDNFAHRQYIGARYVPIFGRKDEESIIWDNTKAYEPLTIVLYQGNSYTSRQFVPAGVDILNQEYWANTGNYNAQVEAYRQEVLSYSDEIVNKSFAFDTVSDMKAFNDLYEGAICHTNGFYESGDGGAAWYVISNSGTANEIDVIACGALFANLINESNTYNVMQYGFKLNDRTNLDTNIIKHLLDNKSGGTIVFPYGKIYLDVIELKPEKIFSFIGFGESYTGDKGTSIFPLNFNQECIFKGNQTGIDYYSFKDISFNGENTCDYGLYCTYATGFLIDRCSFDTFNKTACFLGLGLNNVRNCLIRVPDESESALRIHSDSYITNCEIVGGESSLVVEASGIRLTSCLLYSGSKHSIHVNPTVRLESETAQANNLMIDGCYFGDCGESHIYIPSTNCNNIVVANSYFEMTIQKENESGIYCRNNKTININNNVFLGFSENNENSAIELDACESCVISSNRFSNYQGHGIKLVNTTDTNISNNNMRNLTNDMIRLEGASVRNVINGNILISTTNIYSVYISETSRNNIVFGNSLGTKFNIDKTANVFKDFRNTATEINLSVTIDGTATQNKVYRTDNGIINVELTTPVVTQAISSGTLIGTLPSGYRPEKQIFVLNGTSTLQPFYIEPNGNVYAQFAANSGTTPLRLLFSFTI